MKWWLCLAVGFRQIPLLRHLSGLITGDKSAGSHIELLGRTVQREGRLARDIRKSRANTGYIFNNSTW